ncbi:hypothetical protein ABZ754_21870 [Micromonospora purpureochromogenes]|uniref:hypothetical protein n=1 Tax=Micromonospora purpureochromogenes TaxID=47872 RepID=UPI00340A90AB
MDQEAVVVRLSHDEGLVLFEWLSRTDELTNDFGDLVEDQAEQRVVAGGDVRDGRSRTAGAARGAGTVVGSGLG